MHGYEPEAGFEAAGKKGVKEANAPGVTRPRQWWRNKQERRKNNNGNNGNGSAAAAEPNGTPSKGGPFRRLWNRTRRGEEGRIAVPSALRKDTDFKIHSTLPASRSGFLGDAAKASGSGASGAGGSSTIGSGSYTITGPVTATGQVIAKGKTAGEAKSNLIKGMYEKHQEKYKKFASEASKQKITVHLEKALEEKAPEDISKMHEPEWEKLFKEAEEKASGGEKK